MFEKKKEEKPEEPKGPSMEEIVSDNKELISTLQRLQADFENYKKREEKNKEDFAKFCSSSIFLDMLDIMDSFESALKKCSPEQKEAIEPLYFQMKAFLEKNGIKQFSAVNEIFNPELHEVLMTGYTIDKDENIVLEEFKKGYYIHSKVLRHAQVKINQKPVKQMEEIKSELKEKLEKFKKETGDDREKKAKDSKKVDEREIVEDKLVDEKVEDSLKKKQEAGNNA